MEVSISREKVYSESCREGSECRIHEEVSGHWAYVPCSFIPDQFLPILLTATPCHKKKITRQLSFESSLTDQRLEILRRDFYMDYLISVDNSVDAAINNMHQTTKILARETVPVSLGILFLIISCSHLLFCNHHRPHVDDL